jgi:hypothetical protein
MPSHSHSTAPKFNPNQPHELCHYFSELGAQLLVNSITNKQDQKMQAICYLDIDSTKLWESLAQFELASPYDEFTVAVYKLYSGSEDECKWSVADMERLVKDQACSEIVNITDLGTYHQSFLTIASFLCKKDHNSEAKQSHTYVRGFKTDLWACVTHHLELKLCKGPERGPMC